MTEQNSFNSNLSVETLDERDYEGAEEDSGYDIIDVLTQLALRKWLIAKVTGISMFVGLVLCFVLPVRYTAVTLLMPPKQTQSVASLMSGEIGGVSVLASAAGGGLLKDPNAIYVGLLSSRPIADAIINRFNLVKVYGSKDMTAARKKLDSNTSIVSEKSTLISITVTDGDKKRAAGIANAYAEQLRDLTKTVALTEASRRRLFYEDQLKNQKEKLTAAEVAFQEVQQNRGLVALLPQAKVIIAGLADLRAQIAAQEVDLQVLRSYSTEHNPDVQLAERELSAMQTEAAQLEKHSQPTAYSDMGLKDIPKAGLDYLRAERELQYQQTFFNMMLKQYEAAKLDEANQAAVIQVVEPAVAPEHKSSPKRAPIMLVFIILGIFAGCMLVVILRWNEKLVENDPTAAKRMRALRDALKVRVVRT